MAVLHLQTEINAPVERVFDLARSVDAHRASAEATDERAVAGVTAGLLKAGDEVTWEAKHLGLRRRLTVRMTKVDRPRHFQDMMLAGAFRDMTHDHFFEPHQGRTRMTDRFEFHAPWGPLGWLVEHVFLTAYMRRFLLRRNAALKRIAESDQWRVYL